MPLRWTPTQREIADLSMNGASFNDLVAKGYLGKTVSKVNKALRSGDRPEESQPEPKETPANKSPEPRPITRSTPFFVATIKRTPWEFTEEQLSKWTDIFRAMREQRGLNGGTPADLVDYAMDLLTRVMNLQPVGFFDYAEDGTKPKPAPIADDDDPDDDDIAFEGHRHYDDEHELVTAGNYVKEPTDE